MTIHATRSWPKGHGSSHQGDARADRDDDVRPLTEVEGEVRGKQAGAEQRRGHHRGRNKAQDED